MLGSVGFFKEKVMQEIQRNALSRFQKILKIKMYQSFHKHLKRSLMWFLSDHVTLKTGVMMLKIQLWLQE